jgi:RNA polymerase sporulation-specific sigma factor
MYYQQNDYKILHEIQEGNQDALSLMLVKYKPLISKKIMQFNLGYEYEDMLQEGYMVLWKSVCSFEEQHAKTFTKYFELNLDRKFITIVTKRVRRKEIFKANEHFISESFHPNQQHSVYYELYHKEIAKLLTKQELIVYTLRELQNFSISYICKTQGVKEKTIYNTLHRARFKIKRHFHK